MNKIILLLLLAVFMLGCRERKDPHDYHNDLQKEAMYTCPMPQDSVFSDKPGKCPKCGMELVKMDHENHDTVYTCPMHPEVVSGKPGKCPKCGMDLVKKENVTGDVDSLNLQTLLRPTNEFVISSVPLIAITAEEIPVEIEAYGNVEYDTRMIGSISSRVEGRIEKLYVRHRYQSVRKGQRIMDIYSPELLTAQQNLLFLLKNDSENQTMINAAKQKLMLLGMSASQIQEIIRKGKPAYSVAVFSNYSGHIHDAGQNTSMNTGNASLTMTTVSPNTLELSIKEGMYVKRGQTVLSVYNSGRVWALLNIYAENISSVKKGLAVVITPETAPDRKIRGTVNFVEPFFREGNKTLTARVYFDNSGLRIPVGSQVRAKIFSSSQKGYWLPKESVVSLGINKVAFLKSGNGLIARLIKTGLELQGKVQILSGLSSSDSVALNAQYLMDSESFIKTTN